MDNVDAYSGDQERGRGCNAGSRRDPIQEAFAEPIPVEILDPERVAESFDGRPGGFPFEILGMHSNNIHFLSARGEYVVFSVTALARSQNILRLATSQAPSTTEYLTRIAPPRPNRSGSFDAEKISELIIGLAGKLPVFNPSVEIRKAGLWRCAETGFVMHCGDALLGPKGILPAGQQIRGCIYPSDASLGRPAESATYSQDFRRFEQALRSGWNWNRLIDADVFLGFVGQAFLGQFPKWRSHLYLNGRRGSGKSTLLGIAENLLGPMVHSSVKNASEAGHRSRANHTSLASIFDEQEATGEQGKAEGIIELARQTSDDSGARIVRGSSDQSSKVFSLNGAFLVASIIPPLFQHADKSRWCSLELKARKKEGSMARSQENLGLTEELSSKLAPAIWHRATVAASGRFDAAFAHYRGLILDLGADPRIADTLSAIISGWDLLHFQNAGDPFFGDKAREMALPMLLEFGASDEEGEGEMCLRNLMAYRVQREVDLAATVSEIIQEARRSNKACVTTDRLLGRIGLRFFPDFKGHGPALMVQAGQHPEIDRALASTKWTKGGHKAALMQLDGVSEFGSEKQRIAGKAVSGIIIPGRHLPEP